MVQPLWGIVWRFLKKLSYHMGLLIHIFSSKYYSTTQSGLVASANVEESQIWRTNYVRFRFLTSRRVTTPIPHCSVVSCTLM